MEKIMKYYMRKALAVITCVCSMATQMQVPVFGYNNYVIEEAEVESGYEFVDNYPTSGDWQDGERVKSEKALEVFNEGYGALYAAARANKYTGQVYTHNKMFSKCTVVNGIDVSKWNGSINWAKVKKAGIEFAIIRVGNRGVYDGSLNEDPLYAQNIKGAVAAGIKVGVYIYSQATTTGEAVAEADYVLKRIKNYKITMPVVIDYEYFDGPSGRLYDAHLSKSQATKVCEAFCERVKKAGYTPMIYANASMLNNQLNASVLEKKYNIWLASWGTSNSYNGLYDYWQYSSSGAVDGISGRVDCNFWYNPVKSTGLVLSDSTKTMNVGDTYTFTGTITPANSTDIITWSSSNPAVAYIDYEGRTVAGMRGTTTITGVTTSGVTKTCKLTVYDNMNNYRIFLKEDNLPYTGTGKTPQIEVKTKEPIAVSGTVNANMNLRVGPGTNYNIKLVMPKGAKLTIYNTYKMGSEIWYSVRYNSGGKNYYGYAGGSYITPVLDYRVLNAAKYTTLYGNNVNAGTGTVTTYGLESAYIKGSINSTFTIKARTLKDVLVDEIQGIKYTGNPIQPDIFAVYNNMILKKDKDYKLTYSNNTESGTATVTAAGIGNYCDTINKSFRVYGYRNYYINAVPTQVYSGSAVTPEIQLFDCETNEPLPKTGYSVEYSNNSGVGTGKAVVKATGKYEGVTEILFEIAESAGSGKPVTVYNIDNQQYTGQLITPEFKVMSGDTELTKNDYDVVYNNNKELGIASAEITAKNGYEGKFKIYFEIIRADISGDNFNTNVVDDQVYQGSAITPQIILANEVGSLTAGTDYSIEFINNINAGKATIRLKGLGNYAGIRDVHFNIKAKAINNITIGEISKQIYTGSAIKPALKMTYGAITLKEGVDYVATYMNNVNCGTAKISIVGKGNYSGAITKEFAVVARGIDSVSVTVPKTAVYTGKKIEVKPVVKYINRNLVYGKDYTLSYSKNKSIGNAVVTVTGKNNFAGSKSFTFSIIPKKVTGINTRKVTEKTVTIKWNKMSGISGYQIYRSSSYDGTYKKVKTITTAKTAEYQNSKLEPQSEYYYKIRAYKIVNGKKYYSSFSSIKRVNTLQKESRYGYAKSTVSIMNHAGNGYKKMVSINKNTQVKILADTFDRSGAKWYRVYYKKNGKKYYGYVKAGKMTVECRGKVKADLLNVRSRSSISSRSIAKLKKGKNIRILSQTKDKWGKKWYKIKLTVGGKTRTGYVMSKYVKKY